MSIRIGRKTRPSKLQLAGFTGVVTLALVAGLLAGAPPGEVREVLAEVPCKYANQVCLYDVTKTSTLTVSHVYDPESTNTAVEPDTGESWRITAYWNTPPPIPCFQATETATVDVDWNGSAWVLSNKSLTTNIVDIQLCSTDMYCTTPTEDHAYGYTVIVDINDPIQFGTHHLRQVVYTTSAVDDGHLLNLGTCSLGNSVSPTTQSFSQTDSGAFECAFDCDASGPSIILEYE